MGSSNPDPAATSDLNVAIIGAGIGLTPNAEWAMKVLNPEIHVVSKQVTVQNGTDWFIWMDGRRKSCLNSS
ncbi:hypothetical protein BDW62DRAFT_168763 [Aspergillus aurantiobrunneus]